MGNSTQTDIRRRAGPWAGYLLYNAVMFLFATPYNPLFPAYLAMFSLALWSIGGVLVQTDVTALHRQVTGRLPVGAIGI